MESYVQLHQIEDQNVISVTFDVEADKPFSIGEKMNDLHEEAYMNGYNWEAFFNYYLGKHHLDVLVEFEPDPEAGMFAGYYPNNPENLKRAEAFVTVIQSLIENEAQLYAILEAKGDAIEWD